MAITMKETVTSLLAKPELLIAAGPCSTDSTEVAQATVLEATKRRIPIIRNDVYKPRTNLLASDGVSRVFQGAREEGLGWFNIAWSQNIIPATEIITPKHAAAVREIMGDNPDNQVFLWTGARSGNTEVVEEMANIFRDDPRVLWGTKSTRDYDTELWIGMSDAAYLGGIPDEQRVLIYRGEVEKVNRKNKLLRGTANFDLAMEVKQELIDREIKTHGRRKALKLLFDPSHLSVNQEKILEHARNSLVYQQDGLKFDGLLVEVSDHPSQTDPGITWQQFDSLGIS